MEFIWGNPQKEVLLQNQQNDLLTGCTEILSPSWWWNLATVINPPSPQRVTSEHTHRQESGLRGVHPPCVHIAIAPAVFFILLCLVCNIGSLREI